MAIYTLEPDEYTHHGCFPPDLLPVLTIESGDMVRLRTLGAEWALEPFTTFTPGDPPSGSRAITRVEGPKGHALCGPIALRGALPGMTLAIHIDAVRPGSWGWSWGGGDLVDGEVMHFWTLDAERQYAWNQHGHRVHLRPFLGVMGMPLAEAGQHSTIPPRITGGNLDCKELVAGSTLYLPIAVAGGLFSVGDGHALQGDGEVSHTAIECPMDEVVLTFHLPILDWFSRYVVSWALSDTLELPFVLDAVGQALRSATPQIWNTDQGSQFTSPQLISQLAEKGVRISMDGKGRAYHNIFTERLWRSLKYEEIYLADYGSPRQARQGIASYFVFYNTERPHQALDYRRPADLYLG